MNKSYKRQAASVKQQALDNCTVWDYIRVNRKDNMKAKSTKIELKDINNKLLELYNTPGMALHFQPSKLKILKKQIERLIMLEQVV